VQDLDGHTVELTAEVAANRLFQFGIGGSRIPIGRCPVQYWNGSRTQRIKMQGYIQLGKERIFGAPVYTHWSVLVIGALILVYGWQNLIVSAISLLSFLSIILIHEIGHAAIAHKLGYDVIAIRIAPLHGVCEYQAPRYEWEDVQIAWGGVLAQLIAAAIVFGFGHLGGDNTEYFGPVTVFIGYYSLLTIPFNLLPVPGLDGQKAWKILPLAYDRSKRRHRR
jgi:stage IV sporulation protein FB